MAVLHNLKIVLPKYICGHLKMIFVELLFVCVCVFSETGSCFIVQADLELKILFLCPDEITSVTYSVSLIVHPSLLFLSWGS